MTEALHNGPVSSAAAIVTPSAGVDWVGRARLLDIERAKGLGIGLVVFGHIYYGPFAPEWMANVRNALYLFHMPFFMYLSGYVFAHSGASERARGDFAAYLRNRAGRLLIPFFALGGLIVVGKYYAAMGMAVRNPVDGIGSGLASLFFDTENSPAMSIWYVYVLFVYSVVTPLLLWLLQGRLFLLLAGALALYWLPGTSDFFVDRIFRYYVFFVIGCIFAAHAGQVMAMLDRHAPWFIAAFALTLGFDRAWQPAMLVSGCAAICALHAVMRSSLMDGDRALAWLGQYSFAIYLLNTIFIGLVTAAFYGVATRVDGIGPLYMWTIFLGGLLLPMVCWKVVALGLGRVRRHG